MCAVYFTQRIAAHWQQCQLSKLTQSTQLYCFSFTEISCSSVSLLEINLSFSKDVMLLLSSRSFRTFVGKIEGILFSGCIEQATWYNTGSCLHFSGHSTATLAGTITNHNQNTRAGVANSIDTNTTVSLDGMASCCDLQREELILNVIVFVFSTWWMTVQRYYVGFQ